MVFHSEAAGAGMQGEQVHVCLIVKNEAPYMVEWVAHYLSLGFDRLIVYDNGSTDGTTEILTSFAKRAPVEVRMWPDQEDTHLNKWPIGMHWRSHGANGSLSSTRMSCWYWKSHESIHEFVGRFPEDAGAVVINWMLFGSSSQRKYIDELQSIRFRLCARNDTATKNQFAKSLVRPRAVEAIATHSPVLKPGFFHYTDSAERAEMLGDAKTATVSHRYAQLNHYVVRSQEEFSAKQRRGNPARSDQDADRYTGRDDSFWRAHSTNHRLDAAIDPWVDRAGPYRSRLRQWLAEDGITIA